MPEPELLEQMRSDWNARAREDVRYYVAFGRRGQQDEEFFASASPVIRVLEEELKRLPGDVSPQARRGLEVGCGPGRLLRPMSRNFGEIHGVDVSDEMIRLAQERFHGAASIQLHATNGRDLSPLPSDYFDFVYSYAVFQHIPSREVVLSYFAEIRRVLKDGGLAHFQLNGLPPGVKTPDTWEGVRISRREVVDFACDNDLQLLAIEGEGTQYMWTSWRKQPDAWRNRLRNTGPQAVVERGGGAHTGEPAVPQSGRFAYASFRIARLPAGCDVVGIEVTFDGVAGIPCYLSPPEWDGIIQLNVLLPRGVRTGVVPVELLWLGKPLCPTAWLRIIPPGPVVPRVCSVTDGTNLLAGARVESGSLKLTLEDLSDAATLRASLDGQALEGLEWFQTDALAGRFEFNLRLPADVTPGSHQLELCQGARRFPSIDIEVS
jgi:ubiquinone/menaquinone biosynthesis C-methylase UbiE